MEEIRFYEFKKPFYESDLLDMKKNPIKMKSRPRMPAIICKGCGIWAGTRRLYFKINDPQIASQLSIRPLKPLHEQEWYALANIVKSSLNVQPDFELRPGDQIGFPSAMFLGEEWCDIMHLFPGQVVVSHRVKKIIEEHQCTGIDFVSVNTFGQSPNMKMYEINITGAAWEENVDLKSIVDKSCCGRYIFPQSSKIKIDVSRWDKSDFFNLNKNPNKIFVTQRVANLFEEYGFQNYSCELLSL